VDRILTRKRVDAEPPNRCVRERLEWMRRLVPRRRRAADRDVAAVCACMLGGLILARALGGDEGASLLKDCRKFLHRALEA